MEPLSQDSNAPMGPPPPTKRTDDFSMFEQVLPEPELSDFGLLAPDLPGPELSDFGLLALDLPKPERSDFGLLAEPEPSDSGICAPLSPQSRDKSSKHTVSFMQSENNS